MILQPGGLPSYQQQPMQPQQPSHSQYLADALRQLQGGAQSQISNPEALGSNLLADALLQNGQQAAQQKQAYNAQLQANGIDPTLDPGAGPQSGGDKLKSFLSSMFAGAGG